MGLEVLDLGLELMILKGLFQSKSMNFCEMPLELVKQLEFQWNLVLLIRFGHCGYRCNYWVLMKKNNRLLK